MRYRYLVILALIAVTLAVYWRAANNDFVNYDDPDYVYQNPHVQTVNRDNIVWAFTSTEKANWHPLTWLSHMVDCQLYDLNPRGHHLTSVAIHIVNAVLLFLLLSRLTGTLWRSAFVAALFALHPLHVESVAWVAERKDVLSALFFMLTLLAYTRYVERPGLARYSLVFCSFTLGLMAKPMLVTLPFVLLLLDYWPLGRYGTKSAMQRLLLEKVPLFALSLASSIVTVLAQKAGGAMTSAEALPLAARVANALVSYAGYIGKMAWPDHLAVLYPLSYPVPVWKVAVALLLLAGISVMAIRLARSFPFLPVGWLWFLGTLVPVIGLVQVGSQAMADRYTYLPLIGLFIVIAWGTPQLMEGRRCSRVALAIPAAGCVALLSAVTWQQIGVWKNNQELFTHAIKYTSGNYVAHYDLGVAQEENGRLDEAIGHYNEALHIKPDYAEAHFSLGYALMEQGKSDEAISHYHEALRLNPRDAKVHYNLGIVLAKKGRIDEAIGQCDEALKISPADSNIHNYLGILLAGKGKTDEAIGHFREALKLNPNEADTHYNLGLALASQGRGEEAVSHYVEALRLNPSDAGIRMTLERAQAELGNAKKH